MAGPSTSLSVSVPKRIRANAHEPNMAGTVAGRKPSPGMRSMPSLLNQSTVAALPMKPWPEIEKTLSSLAE